MKLKYLLCLSLCLYGVTFFGQDLNRTWFLESLEIGGTLINIPDTTNPDLSLDTEGDLSEGNGACNGFVADIAMFSPTEISITNFSHTLVFCDTSEEDAFEMAYFNFFDDQPTNTYTYIINFPTETVSSELVLTKTNGDVAVYGTVNPKPPIDFTTEPWYLNYFETNGEANNYPAQQTGQLNLRTISDFSESTDLFQSYICYYGGGGIFSAYNYFGTLKVDIGGLNLLAMDCSIDALNDFDYDFTMKLEGKTHTYEIFEEGQGRRMVLTDENGDRIFYENAFLGTEDFNNELSIDIYPNPAQDIITISGRQSQDILGLEIYDFLGKQVQTAKVSQINIEQLPSGIYFLKAYGPHNKSTIQRFIKK